MADFRKKLFGLTFSAVCFAGMAYGQATCVTTPPGPAPLTLRAEGTTEQVAAVSLTCTTAPGTPVGTITVQDFVSAKVTSKVLSTTGATAGQTEAIAVLTPSVSAAAAYPGTIAANGTTINFPAMATPAAPETYTIAIYNVKVDASTVALGTGAPPNITEGIFVTGGPTVVIAVSIPSINVGFVEAGISSKAYKSGALTTSGGTNFVVCSLVSPINGNGLSTVVQVTEGFQSAFKVLGSEASQAPVTAGSVTNAVQSGTRVKIAFSNVPSNVTIYVPVTVASSSNLAGITLTSSESGSLSAVTPASPTSANGLATAGGTAFVPVLPGNGALAPVSISGGSGVAIYEVTAEVPTSIDVFNVGVYVFATANTVSGSTTGITEAVSFAPVGSTNAPNFAVTTSTANLTGSAFSICTTSLMFPFVTNQLGFDTGLVVSNTSADPFGTTKGASPQAGTCTMNFYGAGAPSPANVATPSIAAGTTYAIQLSSVAAGFQGYIIAQCNFLFAHGFAFITDGVGPNGGLSQGYLAGVIPDTSQLNRGTTPGVGVNVGEFLGN